MELERRGGGEEENKGRRGEVEGEGDREAERLPFISQTYFITTSR